MSFIKKNYVGILHLIMAIFAFIVGVQATELKDARRELSKVKYVNQTIFIQEAPRVYHKEEKIMIDYTIAKYAKKYNVEEALIRSIIKHESGFNPTAMSDAGCAGLMQINGKVHHINNPFDIDENIEIGTRLIAGLIKKYHGDVRTALHAYNCGSGCVARGQVPNSTRRYASNILSARGKV